MTSIEKNIRSIKERIKEYRVKLITKFVMDIDELGIGNKTNLELQWISQL